MPSYQTFKRNTKRILADDSLKISVLRATTPRISRVARGIRRRREPRGYAGHLSSSASWCPDTRQRTLLNQLKLCRPRGVADLSSKYESEKDGANARERRVDEGRMREWQKVQLTPKRGLRKEETEA